MSKNDEDVLPTNTKVQSVKIASKKTRKVFKYRFLTETNLHNVRREQIFYYIISLHKKIRALLKKCKRYKEKILKLVSMKIVTLCDLLFNRSNWICVCVCV